MYKAFYAIAAVCIAALGITLNLSEPPASPIVLGATLGGGALLCVTAGRALQLLGEIRDRLPAES